MLYDRAVASGPPSSAPTLEPPLAGRLRPYRRTSEPVPRPRLLQRLSAWVDSPVFLVHAPAGYGKSTLLGQYAAQRGGPVAWLTLTEADADAVTLLHDLAHALGQAAADDTLIERVSVGPSGVVPLALPRLVTWLHEHPELPTIVLDDVHHLRSTEALDVLAALCDEAPATSSLLLGSRSRPALPLARLRAAGRLLEVDAADLRMTPAEGTAMLRAAGAQVDDAEAALVVRRTEGWPAAIYLAALLLRDGEPLSSHGAVGPDDPHLAEYVREEVLAHADPEDATFLTRSSIFDELRPDICDAVLERTDSAERLRALVDADLLVTPSDASRSGYRVHALFRSLLQAELRDRGANEERELHRRASTVYRERDDWERAIHHAVAADEPGVAAELIWAVGPALVTSGRGATVDRWCAQLGPDAAAEHPCIPVARGWVALEAGDAETAEDCAALVLVAPPDATLPDGASAHGMGLLLRATLGASGTAQTVADATDAAAALPEDYPLRGIALLVLGTIALLARDTERARDLLQQVEHLAAGGVPTLHGIALAHQAVMAIDEDRWDAADALVTRARAVQRAAGIRDYATQAIVAATQALTLAHRGAIAQARADADQAAECLALLRRTTPWLGLATRVVLARARAELGDGGQARALLAEAQALGADEPFPLLPDWRDATVALLERLGSDPATGPALTTAELRTLQYLPTHLSLREIGERLHVSRNTVKTHTVSIYRKLEVASRSEAVARGRGLGLLDA